MIYLCMAAAVFVGDLFIKNHMERSLADGKENGAKVCSASAFTITRGQF